MYRLTPLAVFTSVAAAKGNLDTLGQVRSNRATMATLPSVRSDESVGRRLLVPLLAAVVYLGLPAVRGSGGHVPGHFVSLAQAFLHGRLDIDVQSRPGARIDELVVSEDGGRFYCPYPPLPAVLLLPFVALFGSAVKVEIACRIVSVLNVLLFDLVLGRLTPPLRSPRGRSSWRTALCLLFAFGTVAWHNAELGGDWHLAHAVALSASLLALHEFLGANRSWLVGCWIALVLLTRPTASLAIVFFLAPAVRAKAFKHLLELAAGPCIAVLLLGLYNLARFGDPFTFAYERMLLGGEGRRLMREYGQFHLVFVPRNFFWFFVAPPWPRPDFPWLGYDPRGLSLFLACPPAIYALVAVGRCWASQAVRAASLGVAASLVPLLLYFNTGYWQFGPRFVMDFLPFLMILIIAGMGRRLGWLGYALITLAVMIQIGGLVLDPVSQIPAWLAPAN